MDCELIILGTDAACIRLDDGNVIGGIYKGGDEDVLTVEKAKAICFAVNSHAKLVEALQESKHWLRGRGKPSDHESVCDTLGEAEDMIAAALKLAGVKP